MKSTRKIISIFLIYVMVIMIVPITYAKTNIIQLSDYKIYIDSQPIVFENAIISVDNVVLLPYKEFATGLGIQDNNENIILNTEAGTLAINSDSTKIDLKVGSLVAVVNGKDVKLKTTPIKYQKNAMMYIPAQFVAESLGYKVGFETYLNSMYISSLDSYNQVKEILNKSISVMQSYKKYNFTEEFNSADSLSTYKTGMSILIQAKVDKSNSIIYDHTKTSIDGDLFDSESYFTKNTVYTKDSDKKAKWKKRVGSVAIYNDNLKSSDFSERICVDDSLYTKLIIDQESSDKQIVLKGYAYPLKRTANEKRKKLDGMKTEGLIAIYIDASTYSIKKVVLFYSETSIKDPKILYALSDEYTYSDFNGAFKLTTPKV